MKGFTTGRFVLFIAFIAMFIVLLNKDATPMEKGVVTILCFVFMVIGVIIETPLAEHIRETRNEGINTRYS